MHRCFVFLCVFLCLLGSAFSAGHEVDDSGGSCGTLTSTISERMVRYEYVAKVHSTVYFSRVGEVKSFDPGEHGTWEFPLDHPDPMQYIVTGDSCSVTLRTHYRRNCYFYAICRENATAADNLFLAFFITMIVILMCSIFKCMSTMFSRTTVKVDVGEVKKAFTKLDLTPNAVPPQEGCVVTPGESKAYVPSSQPQVCPSVSRGLSSGVVFCVALCLLSACCLSGVRSFALRSDDNEVVSGGRYEHVSEDTPDVRFLVEGATYESNVKFADVVGSIISFTDGLCSGVLVGENLVLTAAHCLVQPAQVLRFCLGDDCYQILSYEVVDKEFTKIGGNDLGLAVIDAKLDNFVRVLPTNAAMSSCYFFGYGGPTDSGLSRTLGSFAVTPFMCSYEGEVLDNLVCSSYETDGARLCGGDSGGPLICDSPWGLGVYAVASAGGGCSGGSTISMYVDVRRDYPLLRAQVCDSLTVPRSLHLASTEMDVLNITEADSLFTNATPVKSNFSCASVSPELLGPLVSGHASVYTVDSRYVEGCVKPSPLSAYSENVEMADNYFLVSSLGSNPKAKGGDDFVLLIGPNTEFVCPCYYLYQSSVYRYDVGKYVSSVKVGSRTKQLNTTSGYWQEYMLRGKSVKYQATLGHVLYANKPWWYTFMVLAISLLIIGPFSIVYAKRVSCLSHHFSGIHSQQVPVLASDLVSTPPSRGLTHGLVAKQKGSNIVIDPDSGTGTDLSAEEKFGLDKERCRCNPGCKCSVGGHSPSCDLATLSIQQCKKYRSSGYCSHAFYGVAYFLFYFFLFALISGCVVVSAQPALTYTVNEEPRYDRAGPECEVKGSETVFNALKDSCNAWPYEIKACPNLFQFVKPGAPGAESNFYKVPFYEGSRDFRERKHEDKQNFMMRNLSLCEVVDLGGNNTCESAGYSDEELAEVFASPDTVGSVFQSMETKCEGENCTCGFFTKDIKISLAQRSSTTYSFSCGSTSMSFKVVTGDLQYHENFRYDYSTAEYREFTELRAQRFLAPVTCRCDVDPQTCDDQGGSRSANASSVDQKLFYFGHYDIMPEPKQYTRVCKQDTCYALMQAPIVNMSRTADVFTSSPTSPFLPICFVKDTKVKCYVLITFLQVDLSDLLGINEFSLTFSLSGVRYSTAETVAVTVEPVPGAIDSVVTIRKVGIPPSSPLGAVGDLRYFGYSVLAGIGASNISTPDDLLMVKGCGYGGFTGGRMEFPYKSAGTFYPRLLTLNTPPTIFQIQCPSAKVDSVPREWAAVRPEWRTKFEHKPVWENQILYDWIKQFRNYTRFEESDGLTYFAFGIKPVPQVVDSTKIVRSFSVVYGEGFPLNDYAQQVRVRLAQALACVAEGVGVSVDQVEMDATSFFTRVGRAHIQYKIYVPMAYVPIKREVVAQAVDSCESKFVSIVIQGKSYTAVQYDKAALIGTFYGLGRFGANTNLPYLNTIRKTASPLAVMSMHLDTTFPFIQDPPEVVDFVVDKCDGFSIAVACSFCVALNQTSTPGSYVINLLCPRHKCFSSLVVTSIDCGVVNIVGTEDEVRNTNFSISFKNEFLMSAQPLKVDIELAQTLADQNKNNDLLLGGEPTIPRLRSVTQPVNPGSNSSVGIYVAIAVLFACFFGVIGGACWLQSQREDVTQEKEDLDEKESLLKRVPSKYLTFVKSRKPFVPTLAFKSTSNVGRLTLFLFLVSTTVVFGCFSDSQPPRLLSFDVDTCVGNALLLDCNFSIALADNLSSPTTFHIVQQDSDFAHAVTLFSNVSGVFRFPSPPFYFQSLPFRLMWTGRVLSSVLPRNSSFSMLADVERMVTLQQRTDLKGFYCFLTYAHDSDLVWEATFNVNGASIKRTVARCEKVETFKVGVFTNVKKEPKCVITQAPNHFSFAIEHETDQSAVVKLIVVPDERIQRLSCTQLGAGEDGNRAWDVRELFKAPTTTSAPATTTTVLVVPETTTLKKLTTSTRVSIPVETSPKRSDPTPGIPATTEKSAATIQDSPSMEITLSPIVTTLAPTTEAPSVTVKNVFLNTTRPFAGSSDASTLGVGSVGGVSQLVDEVTTAAGSVKSGDSSSDTSSSKPNNGSPLQLKPEPVRRLPQPSALRLEDGLRKPSSDVPTARDDLTDWNSGHRTDKKERGKRWDLLQWGMVAVCIVLVVILAAVFVYTLYVGCCKIDRSDRTYKPPSRSQDRKPLIRGSVSSRPNVSVYIVVFCLLSPMCLGMMSRLAVFQSLLRQDCAFSLVGTSRNMCGMGKQVLPIVVPAVSPYADGSPVKATASACSGMTCTCSISTSVTSRQLGVPFTFVSKCDEFPTVFEVVPVSSRVVYSYVFPPEVDLRLATGEKLVDSEPCAPCPDGRGVYRGTITKCQRLCGVKHSSTNSTRYTVVEATLVYSFCVLGNGKVNCFERAVQIPHPDHIGIAYHGGMPVAYDLDPQFIEDYDSIDKVRYSLPNFGSKGDIAVSGHQIAVEDVAVKTEVRIPISLTYVMYSPQKNRMLSLRLAGCHLRQTAYGQILASCSLLVSPSTKISNPLTLYLSVSEGYFVPAPSITLIPGLRAYNLPFDVKVATTTRGEIIARTYHGPRIYLKYVFTHFEYDGLFFNTYSKPLITDVTKVSLPPVFFGMIGVMIAMIVLHLSVIACNYVRARYLRTLHNCIAPKRGATSQNLTDFGRESNVVLFKSASSVDVLQWFVLIACIAGLGIGAYFLYYLLQSALSVVDSVVSPINDVSNALFGWLSAGAAGCFDTHFGVMCEDVLYAGRYRKLLTTEACVAECRRQPGCTHVSMSTVGCVLSSGELMTKVTGVVSTKLAPLVAGVVDGASATNGCVSFFLSTGVVIVCFIINLFFYVRGGLSSGRGIGRGRYAGYGFIPSPFSVPNFMYSGPPRQRRQGQKKATPVVPTASKASAATPAAGQKDAATEKARTSKNGNKVVTLGVNNRSSGVKAYAAAALNNMSESQLTKAMYAVQTTPGRAPNRPGVLIQMYVSDPPAVRMEGLESNVRVLDPTRISEMGAGINVRDNMSVVIKQNYEGHPWEVSSKETMVSNRDTVVEVSDPKGTIPRNRKIALAQNLRTLITTLSSKSANSMVAAYEYYSINQSDLLKFAFTVLHESSFFSPSHFSPMDAHDKIKSRFDKIQEAKPMHPIVSIILAVSTEKPEFPLPLTDAQKNALAVFDQLSMYEAKWDEDGFPRNGSSEEEIAPMPDEEFMADVECSPEIVSFLHDAFTEKNVELEPELEEASEI
ncbi:putative structural polyprotein [Aplysia californica nido-like virus]|uniref:putative structural polyprotein n=1 Tax=Aplysia californica nido-like virus TaxID=2283236 RepID=UPI000E10E8BF|nr:putative structural polyprotein [Aplysia californica nido-like virus]AXG63958.1 putative structural polyprotein [Aplysia californica nido-like virus]